ncbi:hypothetical protein RRG08_036314 [Elysia crispata]|uniref:Uncharacterized protein n=1 Tax=Elysia crispata TaxID=231223 RepID=A0AAE1DKB7_9GAST|nr:hypothetical protein RRG08_036314 [Elysia crispata]
MQYPKISRSYCVAHRCILGASNSGCSKFIRFDSHSPLGYRNDRFIGRNTFSYNGAVRRPPSDHFLPRVSETVAFHAVDKFNQEASGVQLAHSESSGWPGFAWRIKLKQDRTLEDSGNGGVNNAD